MKKKYDWYKHINLYVVYPDAFKVGRKGSLASLSAKLSYISSMGFNALHVLPFLKSPMKDAGFDVSDFMKVRKSLGGNEAFDELIQNAKKTKVRIFMDLVINHVSDQHKWFKRALAGDEFYRNFFIHSTKEPKLLRVEDDKKGRWAVYKLARRKLRSRIIFLNQEKALPHWKQGDDGFWYYHTFYPHQIDLNWTNLDVVSAFNEIISFWAGKGLNFRIDAAPFAGKSLTGIMEESSLKSHGIVRELHSMAKRANPESVFLIEAAQPTRKTIRYFGDKGRIEGELAYNFNLMQGFWSSFVSKNPSYIWDAHKKTSAVPKHAQWITFLRNHDELSLEYMNPRQREMVYKSLLKNGLDFRGEFGIAGRTASFLDGNIKKIVLMHFILASSNGAPAVIYGDETGKKTNRRYVKVDNRDSNRGPLTERDIEKQSSQKIREELTKIFVTRKHYKDIATLQPKRILNHKKSVFAAEYDLGKKKLVVLSNLGYKARYIDLGDKFRKKTALSINGAVLERGKVTLPSYGGIWVVETKSLTQQ